VRLLNHLTLGRLTIDVSACPPFLAQFVGAWVFGCETRLRKLRNKHERVVAIIPKCSIQRLRPHQGTSDGAN
jgi:hypothetical protein